MPKYAPNLVEIGAKLNTESPNKVIDYALAAEMLNALHDAFSGVVARHANDPKVISSAMFGFAAAHGVTIGNLADISDGSNPEEALKNITRAIDVSVEALAEHARKVPMIRAAAKAGRTPEYAVASDPEKNVFNVLRKAMAN